MLPLSGPNFPEFLLPFRKPKRIRTAFSPNQLLKLEQAFEKNQYVVGQERKELAKNLNLSETQVSLQPILGKQASFNHSIYQVNFSPTLLGISTFSTTILPRYSVLCLKQKISRALDRIHRCRSLSRFDIWSKNFWNCILTPRVMFRGN